MSNKYDNLNWSDFIKEIYITPKSDASKFTYRAVILSRLIYNAYKVVKYAQEMSFLCVNEDEPEFAPPSELQIHLSFLRKWLNFVPVNSSEMPAFGNPVAMFVLECASRISELFDENGDWKWNLGFVISLQSTVVEEKKQNLFKYIKFFRKTQEEFSDI